MKVKYLGPRAQIKVHPYGWHKAGETKDYPEEAGRELVETGVRQRFEAVDGPKSAAKKAGKKKGKAGNGADKPAAKTAGKEGDDGK